MQDSERLPVTLLDLLSNALVLRQTAPYIPVKELRRLTKVSRAFRELVYTQPDLWRYLDLTAVKRAVIDVSPIDVGGVSWRAERMDESLTEDDFYSGPLRGIFGNLHSKQVLQNVHTLVLDGLSVPADLVREVVAGERYRVRILSIREAKNLNVAKLQQVLRYVVRPTRAQGTPNLRALYFFGPKQAPRTLSQSSKEQAASIRELGVMSSSGAQIGAEWNHRSSDTLALTLDDEESKWYGSTGRAIKRPSSDWPDTLQACKSLINFDAVLCRGPKHDITKVDSKDFLQPAIATIALGGGGCESCGCSPEGPAVFGETDEWTLPLLGPVPTHSTTVRAAQRPESHGDLFPKLFLRCEDCLRNRWCEQCNRWWCEACYSEPVSRAHMRTEFQQVELREELQQNGWASVQRGPSTTSVKVFSKLCVEHCLVNEMMAGAGSNGMWG